MTLVIGHIALVQRSKKQDFVLDVIRRLRQEGLDVIGLFAGEAREKDYMKELEEKITQKGLSDSVLFLGRRNDIADLLKMMDILIIPSFEGFPLAGLEAAAAGVPVAACDTAGAREFIEVGGGGLIFKGDDVADAVSRIKEIMLRKKAMAEKGKKFAEKSAINHYEERIEEIFQSVI